MAKLYSTRTIVDILEKNLAQSLMLQFLVDKYACLFPIQTIHSFYHSFSLFAIA